MTTAIIVQARMGSQRLAGKVMAPAAGRPLLSYLIERLRPSELADGIVIGTTTDAGDDVVARLAAEHELPCYRWPSGQSNLLAGYIAAAKRYRIDTIVRVTADCPLIDVAYLDAAIAGLGSADYLMPVGLPDGMGCEVVRLDALERALPMAADEEREHVTLYIRRHPELFHVVPQDTGLGLDAERWTVDTPQDLALVRHVIETLPPGFTLSDIRALLAAHPAWRALNAAVPAGPIDNELAMKYALPMRVLA